MSDPFRMLTERVSNLLKLQQNDGDTAIRTCNGKIVNDYLIELEFTNDRPTVEVGCGPGAISRRIAKHAKGNHDSSIRHPII